MQANDQQRIVDLARPADQPKPVTMDGVQAFLAIVLGVVVAVLILGGAIVGLVYYSFGDEGVRMLTLAFGLFGMFFLALWVIFRIIDRSTNSLTRVQEVAVQSIIQHQRADDQGEVARMMPAVFKALMDNQHKSQQLATEMNRHGRWMVDNEMKVARNAKPALPFDFAGGDDDMEEII